MNYNNYSSTIRINNPYLNANNLQQQQQQHNNQQVVNNLLNGTKSNGLLNMFTIEQWELMRRLRNSGLSKEQICLAYDEIVKIERELGNTYATPFANLQQSDGSLLKSITNSLASNLVESMPNTPASTIVNNFFARIATPDAETKELDAFRARGDFVAQKEIAAFVAKQDLKQSQLARMSGINQAYVSKFLRGDFVDLSENSKKLMYKWYLRYTKNPNIFSEFQMFLNFLF